MMAQDDLQSAKTYISCRGHVETTDEHMYVAFLTEVDFTTTQFQRTQHLPSNAQHSKGTREEGRP